MIMTKINKPESHLRRGRDFCCWMMMAAPSHRILVCYVRTTDPPGEGEQGWSYKQTDFHSDARHPARLRVVASGATTLAADKKQNNMP